MTKESETDYAAVPPTPKLEPLVQSNAQEPSLKKKKATFLDKYEQDGPMCEKENPFSSAGLISYLTVDWLQPLVSLGARKVLEETDLWPIARENSCDELTARFMRVYEPILAVQQQQLKQQEASATAGQPVETKPPFIAPVAKALVKTFQREFTIVFINYSVYILALALQSYIAQAMLDYLNDRVNIFHVSNGYVLVIMMMVTSFIAITCLNCGFFISQRLGVNVRTVIMDVIYQKSLRLSSGARQAYTTGEIVTLMSVDAERVFLCMSDGPWFFVAPFGLILTVVLIALLFDVISALCGAVLMFVVMYVSYLQADRIGQLQSKLLYVVDERVKVTSEALQGIRVMKFYAWEESLARRVEKLREVEVHLYRKFHNLQIVNTAMLFLTPTLLSGVTLGVYVLMEDTISVTDAFTLVAMVNISRHAVHVFPRAIAAISQGLIAFNRIDTYLVGEELDVHRLLEGAVPTNDESAPVGTISVRDAQFQWSHSIASPDVVLVRPEDNNEAEVANHQNTVTKDDTPSASVAPSPRGFRLEGVNIEVDAGELVMIVGVVGSGKSSLLNAILGEMALTDGHLSVNGKLSYVSQESWIRNSSVKENILFESAFDADQYQRVLEATQLALDLNALPHGDQTEIGERGINLSGGQKARVAIARAMYRPDYDILILDDPLSAVDPHVAHAIFNECIVGLAMDKTRLLVLNSHYDLLVHADKILVVQDGRIVGDGSYDQIVAQFPDLRMQSEALAKLEQDVIDEHNSTDEEEKNHEIAVAVARKRTGSLKQKDGIEVEKPQAKDDDAAKLVKAEDRVKGKVTGAIYKAYFDEAGMNGILLLVIFVVLYIVSQGVRTLCDWWQGHWAREMRREGVDPTYSNLKFGMWYLGLIVLCCILIVGRGLMLAEACILSAKNLHNELFRRVLAAPVNRYFDVTPVGRILNRFSNDLDQMDATLPQQYQITFQNTAQVFGSLVVSAFSSYWIGVSYIPMIGIFIATALYFQKTSREVKRLEGISRTPVYNLFGETLTGLHTIRAFKMQDRFVRLNKDAVDTNTRAYFSYWAAGRWLAVRLDWLSIAIVFVVSIYLIATKGQISAVTAGISLTYSMMLTSVVQNTVRAVDKTDNAMTSVERLLHFREIPVEDDGANCTPINPELWPSQGAIKFDKLRLKYRPELPLVLRGVNMEIQGGEKVGICGRTGAGKSSLMIALFRICEFESGSVFIDGIDIQSVKLRDLRRSLAIIPQDPVLYSGSLRENLDPFGEYSDNAIWSVLQQVQLADTVTKWGAGLDFTVSESGDNLSVGQRQLLCIARALLKDSKIVVLDEATANVDTATDNLIQMTIKETFVAKTVLIIAHRINTIMHCNKIAVMDAGRVAEFGSPEDLLSNPDSIFTSLAKRSIQ
ncbi:Multidrug resistance-associated protein abc superfamily, partial [Globisporangium splendens]